MKKCKRCGIEKELSEYYKHNQMSDGTLNICKKCKKLEESIRYSKNALDESWIEKERKRGRIKAKKYKYKQCTEVKKRAIAKHKEKFPEKLLAKNRSQRLNRKAGFNNHHWSYNEEHYKDVITIDLKKHMKAHRFLKYDQEFFMYRTIVEFDGLPSGILLDTKDRHHRYILFVVENFDD